MYFFKNFKRLFFVLVIMFFTNLNVKNVNSKQAALRYYEDRFEINVPALPTVYENLFSNLEDAYIEIKDGKIIINNLVPDQVYNEVQIKFNDNLGRRYEIELDNVITSKPNKPNNKFVYDVYGNGLGRRPDHTGFKYWQKRLENLDITSVEFIAEIINSDEFNSVYDGIEEKIDALYKIVVGREADKEGFYYWLSEFLNLRYELDDRQALVELVKKMVMSDEFKSIVEDAGFLYM